MNKYSKKLTLIIVTIVMLVMLSMYGFLFWRVQKNITQAHYELSKKMITEDRTDIFKKTQQTLANLSEKIQRVDTSFIGDKQEVAFIEHIEQLARDTGLEIITQEVAIIPQTYNKIYGDTLNLSILVSGEWQNNINFIHLLESLPYKINITQITSTKESFSGSSSKDTTLSPSQKYWESAIHFNVLKHPQL